MRTYANMRGTSNVRAYEVDEDSIRVQFGDGSVYTYTHESAGRGNVEEMKALAEVGQGLNSYINRRCRKLYASKR